MELTLKHTPKVVPIITLLLVDPSLLFTAPAPSPLAPLFFTTTDLTPSRYNKRFRCRHHVVHNSRTCTLNMVLEIDSARTRRPNIRKIAFAYVEIELRRFRDKSQFEH